MGTEVYKTIDKCLIFDQIMRQKDDDQAQFRQILENMVTGQFSHENIKQLQDRDYNKPVEDKEKFDEKAIKLCATNKALIKFNIQKLEALETPKILLKAKNIPSHGPAKRASSSTAGGLQSAVLLAEGARVMITRNLWTDAGLVNGAQGTIYKIVYKPDNDPSKGLPDVIYVDVPQYIGPARFPDLPKVVPITPQTATWMDGKKFCSRTQYPLVPAYAITIHKSQGMTLELVILDVGDREFAVGLSYTGMSRVKRLEDLAFDKMPSWARLNNFCKRDIFQKRLAEDKRLADLEQAFLEVLDLENRQDMFDEFFDAQTEEDMSDVFFDAESEQ